MRRGEVREYLPAGAAMVRVVVLSADAHNDAPNRWPVCALIVRRPQIAHPYIAPLADVDPVGGAVDVTTLGPLNPQRMAPVPVGMLTGATLERVAAAVAAFFEL